MKTGSKILVGLSFHTIGSIMPLPDSKLVLAECIYSSEVWIWDVSSLVQPKLASDHTRWGSRRDDSPSASASERTSVSPTIHPIAISKDSRHLAAASLHGTINYGILAH